MSAFIPTSTSRRLHNRLLHLKSLSHNTLQQHLKRTCVFAPESCLISMRKLPNFSWKSGNFCGKITAIRILSQVFYYFIDTCSPYLFTIYMWIYTFGSLLLAYGEMFLFRTMYQDKGARNMYIFTLPIFLPYFYWALRHPRFGEGSWTAIIGKKYSADIYIFHVLAATWLSHFLGKGDSLLIKAAYPFMVFAISLCAAWLFNRLLKWMKRCWKL